MARQLTSKWCHGKQGTTDAFYIRGMVFMVEQGFKNEFDELDARSWHLTIYDHGDPAGTGRIYQEKGQWHAGRICVMENYRGKGLGRELLKQMEEKIRELGGTSVEISAQIQAKGFYARSGYKEQGDVYNDEFCPHIRMTKEW